eukprot:8223287-Prorocentrum_lima.AAC.1
MTSSLVGSEMCIRDSTSRASKHWLEGEKLRWGSPALASTGVSFGDVKSCLLYTSDAADDM